MRVKCAGASGPNVRLCERTPMADCCILAMHYVCTHDKARELVGRHSRFWVSNCGCRESRKHCARSRMDVCLMFIGDEFASGSGKREITLADVESILHEAETKNLVARPFRNDAKTETDGICFCCDDCCGYFLNAAEKCDKGELIARTDFDPCTHCGICEEACYFKARTMRDDQLTVDADRCYGCGLCVSSCPEECIEMTPRHNPPTEPSTYR